MVCRINYRPEFGPVVGYAFKQAKSPLIVASSLCGVTSQVIINEFEGIANRNHRCKNPCGHFVLSPAAGEKITGSQWQELCNATAQEFGAKQWVAVLHRDTNCEHVSLVMSRIGLDGKAWSTSNDRYRLRGICTSFEEQHGLTRTATQSNEPRVVKEEIEKAGRLYTKGIAPNPIPERLQIAVAVKAAMQQSPTIEAFEQTLLRQKIVTRWRHDEQGRPVGVSYARGEAAISGRNAGLTCRALAIYYGSTGTTTHEQSSRSQIPGRGALMDRAPRGSDSHENTSRFGREHGGAYIDPCGVERHGRSAVEVPRIDSTFKQIGDILTRSLSGLNLMIEEDLKDGERLMKQQQPRFIPKHKIYKTKGISV